MPLDTDADRAGQLMLEALQAHPATLANPAPLVRLDNLNASSMTFSMTCYVHSPREVGAVKSDILFDALARLRAANLPLSTPQSMMVRTLGPLGEDSPVVPSQPS
jgi:small-conductance mechanosensitive channel